MSTPQKVVNVGFGGPSAAEHLKSDLVDTTLFDRRNYHLFQSLLNQVESGSLSRGEMSAPLRSILGKQKNTRVWLVTVIDVDTESKHVFFEDGAILPYGSLIVASGSQTSYFDHSDWPSWAGGLKSTEESNDDPPQGCTHLR